MRPPTLTIGALALAVAASALVASPASAATAAVSTIDELTSAVTSAGTATVSGAISAPTATIAVGSGIVTIDLNGRDVSVQRVEVAQGATLRITNSSTTRATFTADASLLNDKAAFRTTNATLEISGQADVLAHGGDGGAGVGGDRGNGGGFTKVYGTATLHAIGMLKGAGIGAGQDGGGTVPTLTIADAAVVTVEADSAAPSAIGDWSTVGVVKVEAGARLIIPIGSTVVVATPANTGAKLTNNGTIVVGGTLSGGGTTINSGSISGTGSVALPSVQGSAFAITFDAAGGDMDGAATVTIYADTFAAAQVALPTASRFESGFDGWSIGAKPLTSTTSLSEALGSAKSATATAIWKGSTSISLARVGSVTFGETVTLSATVPTGLTGAVEFFAGDTSLGRVSNAAGIAPLTLDWPLTVGTYSVVARFSNGDTAGSSDPQKVTVNKAETQLAFATASDSVPAGQSTSVRVSITPRTATGTVRFTIGTSFVDVPIAGGLAAFPTPTSLATGTYSVLATYSGSSDWYSSDDTHTLTVTAATKTSTNTVSSARASNGTDGRNGANGADGVSSSSTTSMITMLITAKATTVVTISGKKFAKRSKPVLTLKVGTPAAIGGKVVIYVGKKKAKTVTVTKTTMTVKLKKKYAKTLRVRAVFLGTSAVQKASSKAIKLRVK